MFTISLEGFAGVTRPQAPQFYNRPTFERPTLYRRQDVGTAVRNLQRRMRPDMRAMRKDLIKLGKSTQKVMAAQVAAETGVKPSAAKRRIRLRFSKRPTNPFVVLSVAEDASVIHAGRLNLTARGHKVMSIGGMSVPPGTYLYKPKLYKGKKRRVYVRQPGGQRAQPLNHPLRIQHVFETTGRAHVRAGLFILLRQHRLRHAARNRR